MKIFLKHVGEFLMTCPQVRLTKTDEVLIRDSAMNHLGLTNLNQMRDRYEGQAFFEKTMKNVGGLNSLQKYLNIDIIDSNKLSLGDFQPYIMIDGIKVNINVFDFGTLPQINIKNIKNPIFFIIQKDRLTFLLCGLASKDVIKNNLIKVSAVKSSTNKYMDFVGFKFLKKIK